MVAASPRFRTKLPNCVSQRLFPPRPMGWREYFIRREAAVMRRGGMEVRCPEDVDRQPGVTLPPELQTLIEKMAVEATKAAPEARKHLTR